MYVCTVGSIICMSGVSLLPDVSAIFRIVTKNIACEYDVGMCVFKEACSPPYVCMTYFVHDTNVRICCYSRAALS